MRARALEPEYLDTLPMDDPRAVASRRDLGRINALMFQGRILRGLLAGWPAPCSIIELGAGDGRFLLNVARKLPCWRGARVVFLDRQDLVTAHTKEAFSHLGWTVECAAEDVFTFMRRQAPRSCDLVIANLFLHHFTNEQLLALFADIARVASGFAATEPERSALGIFGSRCLPLLLCNDVTRHDALVSVRAGFRRQELSDLWPDGKWTLRERTRLFTHAFAARRMSNV